MRKPVRLRYLHPLVADAWPRIGAFVVETADLAGTDGNCAPDKIRWPIGRITAWADHKGLPLDREAVFTPDRVEEFCADSSPWGIATLQSADKALRM